MCLQNFLWPTSIKLRGTNPAEIAAKLGYGSNLKKKKRLPRIKKVLKLPKSTMTDANTICK